MSTGKKLSFDSKFTNLYAATKQKTSNLSTPIINMLSDFQPHPQPLFYIMRGSLKAIEHISIREEQEHAIFSKEENGNIFNLEDSLESILQDALAITDEFFEEDETKSNGHSSRGQENSTNKEHKRITVELFVDQTKSMGHLSQGQENSTNIDPSRTNF